MDVTWRSVFYCVALSATLRLVLNKLKNKQDHDRALLLGKQQLVRHNSKTSSAAGSTPITTTSQSITKQDQSHAPQAPIGHPHGTPLSNVSQITSALKKDDYDLEILLSFGKSNLSSGGHLALCIREHDVETVYSANFYADRDPKHQEGYFTRDLISIVPKDEYIYGVNSSLDDLACFGVEYGEIYSRALIGIRLAGITQPQKDALKAFYSRLNNDFHAKKQFTDYYDFPIVYGYTSLNCARTTGMALEHVFGMKLNMPVERAWLPSVLTAALPVHVTINAMRGFMDSDPTKKIDTVLYQKYDYSTFKYDESSPRLCDMPNRFPSYFTIDYLRRVGQYEHYNNLFAQNLLFNLGSYKISFKNSNSSAPAQNHGESSSNMGSDHVVSLVLERKNCKYHVDQDEKSSQIVENDDDSTQRSRDLKKDPLKNSLFTYEDWKKAVSLAKQRAEHGHKSFIRRLFHAIGVQLSQSNDNTSLYHGEIPKYLLYHTHESSGRGQHQNEASDEFYRH